MVCTYMWVCHEKTQYFIQNLKRRNNSNSQSVYVSLHNWIESVPLHEHLINFILTELNSSNKKTSGLFKEKSSFFFSGCSSLLRLVKGSLRLANCVKMTAFQGSVLAVIGCNHHGSLLLSAISSDAPLTTETELCSTTTPSKTVLGKPRRRFQKETNVECKVCCAGRQKDELFLLYSLRRENAHHLVAPPLACS